MKRITKNRIEYLIVSLLMLAPFAVFGSPHPTPVDIGKSDSGASETGRWEHVWKKRCDPPVRKEFAAGAPDIAVPAPPEKGWAPFHPGSRLQKNGCTDELWLRVRLSEFQDHILISNVFSSVDLFTRGDLTFTTQNEISGGYPVVLIKIPHDAWKETIYIRITSFYKRIGLLEYPVTGDISEIIRKSFQANFFLILVGFFSLSQGISSIITAFLRSKKVRSHYIWFGFLAFFSGVWILSSLNLTYLVYGSSYPFFLVVTGIFHLWMASFFLILHKYIKERSIALLLMLAIFHIGLSVIHPFLVNRYFNYKLYDLMYIDLEIINPGLTIFGAVVILYYAIGGIRQKENEEWRLTGMGIAVLSLMGIVTTLAPSVGVLPVFLYYYVVFGFVILMAYVRERSVANLEERLEIRSSDLKKREVELRGERLKLQQSRMNPHFLLNALGMFYALLEKRRIDTAKEALLFLSDHYRFLTDRSFDATIPLSRELEFCKNYLKLQSLRFEGQLEYSFAGELSGDPLIPPLSLQPLIENAIRHGIRHITNAGKIDVEISGSDRGAKIRIVDNGIGIGDEYDSTRSLDNIRNRLMYYYDHVALTLNRLSFDGGTEVILHFEKTNMLD